MNIIDKASDRIRENGWWRGAGHDGSSHCIVTAVAEVGYGDEKNAAYDAMLEELGFPASTCTLGPVFAFNDDPSTSLEDVLLLMKRASARLDEAAL